MIEQQRIRIDQLYAIKQMQITFKQTNITQQLSLLSYKFEINIIQNILPFITFPYYISNQFLYSLLEKLIILDLEILSCSRKAIMKTQVIKFNTLKDNVGAYLQRLANKVGLNKNYDVTLIVKHNQPTETDELNTGKSILTNSSILNKGFIQQQPHVEKRFRNSKESLLNDKIDIHAFNQEMQVQNLVGDQKQNMEQGRHHNKIPSISINYKFNKKQDKTNKIQTYKQTLKKTDQQQEENQKELENFDNQDDDQFRNISRTKIDIFPNIQFEPISSLKNVSAKRLSTISLSQGKKAKSGKVLPLGGRIGSSGKSNKSIKIIAEANQQRKSIIKSTGSSKGIIKSSKTSIKSGKQGQKVSINPYVIKVNDHDMISQEISSQENNQESHEDDEQDQDDSINDIFIVQNKLNDAMKFLQKNQLSNLEDFLYDFKDKYIYLINTRVQIKWRLLMAHCKQNRKQYERAAINYNQVIQISKQHPKSLTINPADVYHRLGICYSQINQYNKGIVAFTIALNGYKQQKNNIKYAQCLNNLGSLYLVSNSINEAEKCFLMSYQIKKTIFGNQSNNLLTSLFNMFQCNLVTKNFDQAQNLLKMMEEIIGQIKNNNLYLGGLYRRRGKLFFLRGNLNSAQDNYLKAQKQLVTKYPYCMEYGELLGNFGLLKIQQCKYNEAKQLFQKALMLLNFYYCKQSTVISTIKKNIELVQNLLQEVKERRDSSRPSFFNLRKNPAVSFAL